MKRLISIFLVLLLLAACGGKATPSSKSDPSSDGGLVVYPPDVSLGDPDDLDDTLDGPGGDGSIPQADVALIREIVFTYGAYEDPNQPGTIIPKNRGLFVGSVSWSGENGLEPSSYLNWEYGLPTTEEEQAAIDAGQQYAEGRVIGGFDSFFVGPGALVEGKIISHFEVTAEHLHSDPELYDGSIPGYFLPAGGGKGATPTISFTYQQDGDILTIPVILTGGFPDPEETYTLTVRLEPDGGWKYLGCQIA